MLEIASAARSTPTPRFDFFFDCSSGEQGAKGLEMHSNDFQKYAVIQSL